MISRANDTIICHVVQLSQLLIKLATMTLFIIDKRDCSSVKFEYRHCGFAAACRKLYALKLQIDISQPLSFSI